VRRHVDPETLAAFGEELLPRRKARRVAAHLAHCAQCAGLDAQLAGLPALLASAPAPPMPDALTTRIEAALAAEAAARPATAPAGAPGSAPATGAGATPAGPGDDAGTAHDRHRGRAAAPGRSRLALRVAAVAAAVVVIAGGGYGVSRLLSGGGPAATAAPALAPAGSPAVNSAAGRAAHAPAASRPREAEGSGAVGSATGERQASLGPAADLVVASGTNYRPGQLQAQVSAVLARFGKTPAPKVGGISGPANGLASLPGCVAHAAGGLRARLVDQARYDGKPATVIAVPAGPDTLRVLVVGPRCSAAATDLITSTTMPLPR
jgi:hypothetical protein